MSFFDDLGGSFEEQTPKAAPKVLKPGIHKATFANIKVYEKDGNRRLNIEFQIDGGGRHWETIWANPLSGEEKSMKDYAIAKAAERATIERDGVKYGMWGKKELSQAELVKKYLVMRIEREITRFLTPVLTDSAAALLNGLSNGIKKGSYNQPTTVYDLAFSFLKLSGVVFNPVEDEKHIAIAEINLPAAIKLTANNSGEKLGLSYGQNRVVANSVDQLQIITEGQYVDNMDYIVPSTEDDNLTAESADTPPIADAEEELDW